MDASNVMNGTWGEAWMDSDYVSECYGLQAKVDVKKEPVPMCRRLTPGQKIVGLEPKGSIKLNKVNSRMAIKIGNKLKRGEDVKLTIISKLADPSAYGAERVVLKGVSFDDLTLADWEAMKNGQVECPFTFEDYEFIDLVQPQ